MRLGDYVHIGAHSVIEAAQIGHRVRIGDRCIIVRMCSACSCQGKFCILRDGAVVLDGAVLAPNTVVPSMCIFGGVPGTYRVVFISQQRALAPCPSRSPSGGNRPAGRPTITSGRRPDIEAWKIGTDFDMGTSTHPTWALAGALSLLSLGTPSCRRPQYRYSSRPCWTRICTK